MNPCGAVLQHKSGKAEVGTTDCWRFATESLLQQLLAFVELTIWPGPLFAAIYVWQ